MRQALRLTTQRAEFLDESREKLGSICAKDSRLGVIALGMTGQIWKIARQPAGKKGSMSGFIYWR
jgi:hypothetical protein